MILPKIRDPRFILVRRGGSLTDERHRLLAMWAALCAEHVTHYFEDSYPEDDRPRTAIDSTRSWARGEISVTEAKACGFHANKAAGAAIGAARFAAYSAGQAAVVSHVAAHELGAAAYAIRAVMAAVDALDSKRRGLDEAEWQRDMLPPDIKDLVIEDEHNRDSLCWNMFFIKL